MLNSLKIVFKKLGKHDQCSRTLKCLNIVYQMILMQRIYKISKGHRIILCFPISSDGFLHPLLLPLSLSRQRVIQNFKDSDQPSNPGAYWYHWENQIRLVTGSLWSFQITRCFGEHSSNYQFACKLNNYLISLPDARNELLSF